MWQIEREAAEVTPLGVRVLRKDSRRPVAIIWNPKATKPTLHYSYSSVEQREAAIQRYLEQFASKQAQKANRATDAREKVRQFGHNVQVGTIFVHSWGYDQTNVDFYQVVRKSGQTVEIRPIGSEQVESYGPMSGTTRAVPDAFLTKDYRLRNADGSYRQSLTKRVQFNDSGAPYLSFEYGWCGLWDGKPHYESSYA
jgi:hypothetical protein